MYKKSEKIEKFYIISDVLGEGSFAVVKKAVRIKTGEEVAVKIFKK